MLSTKLHHFAILELARRKPSPFTQVLWVQPVETKDSNYQRMSSPKAWKAGCVKDGQGPFDSCTYIMLYSPAPIRPL